MAQYPEVLPHAHALVNALLNPVQAVGAKVQLTEYNETKNHTLEIFTKEGRKPKKNRKQTKIILFKGRKITLSTF